MSYSVEDRLRLIMEQENDIDFANSVGVEDDLDFANSVGVEDELEDSAESKPKIRRGLSNSIPNAKVGKTFEDLKNVCLPWEGTPKKVIDNWEPNPKHPEYYIDNTWSFEELVSALKPMLIKYARRYKSSVFFREDAINAGLIGIWKAINKDTGRISFIEQAESWIRPIVSKAFRDSSTSFVPYSKVAKFSRNRNFINPWTGEVDNDFNKELDNNKIQNYELSGDFNEDEGGSILDYIISPDTTASAEEEGRLNNVKKLLVKIFDDPRLNLKENEKRIMFLSLGLKYDGTPNKWGPLPNSKIGLILDLTKARIGQIKQKVITKIQEIYGSDLLSLNNAMRLHGLEESRKMFYIVLNMLNECTSIEDRLRLIMEQDEYLSFEGDIDVDDEEIEDSSEFLTKSEEELEDVKDIPTSVSSSRSRRRRSAEDTEELEDAPIDWTGIPEPAPGKTLKELKNVCLPWEGTPKEVVDNWKPDPRYPKWYVDNTWSFEELVSAIKPSLVHHALRWSSPTFSREDAINAGMMGIWKSIQNDKGESAFTTYVWKWIKVYVTRGVANSGVVTMPYTKTKKVLDPRTGNMINVYVGKSKFPQRDFNYYAGSQAQISGDAPTGASEEGEGASMLNLMPSLDITAGAKREGRLNNIKELLVKIFNDPKLNLTKNEKRVIFLSLGLKYDGTPNKWGPLSNSKIAELFDLTNVRIGQIKQKVIAKIQEVYGSDLPSLDRAMRLHGLEESRKISNAVFDMILNVLKESVKLQIESEQPIQSIPVSKNSNKYFVNYDFDSGVIVKVLDEDGYEVNDVDKSVIYEAEKLAKSYNDQEVYGGLVNEFIRIYSLPVIAVVENVVNNVKNMKCPKCNTEVKRNFGRMFFLECCPSCNLRILKFS